MKRKICLATVLLILYFLITCPFAMANMVNETSPPALEGPYIGVLPAVVTNDAETDMALTSVTGVPDTLMIQIKSGDKVLAVVRGNEVIYSVPFVVNKTQMVELHLAGDGLPTKTRLVFEPAGEIWGEININILPSEDSDLTGEMEINILPSEECELTGNFNIKFF